MTSRDGGFAQTGSFGSGTLGGRKSPNAGGVAANNPPPPSTTTVKYKMVAKNSLGALVSWITTYDDKTGAEWVGGNTPLTGISLARKVVLTVSS